MSLMTKVREIALVGKVVARELTVATEQTEKTVATELMGAAAVMELDEVMELKKTVEEIALMEGNDLTLPATMMVLLKAEAQEMTSLAEEDLLGEEALTQEEETLILQLEADLGGQREMTLVVEEVQEVPKAQEEDQEEGVEKLALEKMV
mmetsp:Transcript_1423/g.1424  ORF Transcript_1423/g.1424 Transcript_1423/m.1424 type:complete len:150 (-) Transcript_1423:148-597(-)